MTYQAFVVDNDARALDSTEYLWAQRSISTAAG